MIGCPRKSQNARIIEILEREGYVTRNQCLHLFPAITRLGARIDDLEHLGYKFRPERTATDYIYHLVSAPTYAKEMPNEVPRNGQIIETISLGV